MTDIASMLVRVRGAGVRAARLGKDWIAGRRTSRSVVHAAMRVSRFERWGVRLVTQRRLTKLVDASHRPPAAPPPELPPLPQIADLHAALDVANATIAHLRRVVAAAASAAPAAEPARDGVQAFVDEFQHILFETRETSSQSKSATTLVVGGAPAADAVATLVNLADPLHGARPFQYVVPFLATPAPFPLAWPADALPLTVVDIGSQELAQEGDMHAPLRHAAPTHIIGFDPFSRGENGDDSPVKVQRPDGAVLLTYPHLIGDGSPVRFHINRYDATSSILSANHALTRRFGLLDQALETVEVRELLSHRLDDILTDPTPIDLLKVDVQGACHTVLANAPAALSRSLVCHLEVEFAEVYAGERMFGDIDVMMREAGFDFLDFFALGRQRYAAFEQSPRRAFHRGRTLWGDAVYVRGLDREGILNAEELRRVAWVLHCCYNKQDVAAELLGRADAIAGTHLQADYLASTAVP